jgi:hypothetical protein
MSTFGSALPSGVWMCWAASVSRSSSSGEKSKTTGLVVYVTQGCQHAPAHKGVLITHRLRVRRIAKFNGKWAKGRVKFYAKNLQHAATSSTSVLYAVLD